MKAGVEISARNALTDLPAGVTVYLQSFKEGFYQQCVGPQFTVTADTSIDLRMVSADSLATSPAQVPGRAVTGTIYRTTPEGREPVPDAFVDYETIDGFVSASTKADSSGRYLLCGLPQGPVTIGASDGERDNYAYSATGDAVDIVTP